MKRGGGLLRGRPDGGEPELAACGFRNPLGPAFAAVAKHALVACMMAMRHHPGR